MTDSDARASDEDVPQGLAARRAQLLSRLRAGPHAKTIEEERGRIVAQVCEFTIEVMEEEKRLHADMMKQLKDRIKQQEESMNQLDKATKQAREYIESRHTEAQPASEDIKFLEFLLSAYEIDWKLFLEEAQQAIDEAG